MGEAADLVDAMATVEKSANAQDGVHAVVESVRARRVAQEHWIPGGDRVGMVKLL